MIIGPYVDAISFPNQKVIILSPMFRGIREFIEKLFIRILLLLFSQSTEINYFSLKLFENQARS